MRRLGACVAVLCIGLSAGAVTVEPNPVDMGAFFKGGVLRVRGTTMARADVFVTVTGTTVRERFNRKGRLGPLWANVGSVTVAGVPRLHLGAGTVAADRALSRALVDEHLLDLDALARAARVEPAGRDAALMQREYVRLKQAEGVYGVFPGAVSLGAGEAAVPFEARLPWPDTGPPGAYRLEILHVEKGAVVRREEGQVQVRLVGLPRLIAHMAFERSALYGALAVIVALAVGFVMGLCFKRKGGAAH
jgi:hypothetical protein